MTQTRRRFPESFKRKAVDQVLADTPFRHVAETLGIAERLLGKAGCIWLLCWFSIHAPSSAGR
jgi:hypothetical protein